MKKIYYLIAMAVMAFTFTSCEDVPEPFGQPINPNSGADAGTADPAGSGTATDPYNVAGILDYTKSLGADVTSPNDVYFTGIITEVGEAYGTNFGNATFRIGDTEKSKSTFYCYRCMYIGNVKYTDDKATNIKVGDKVVVCGKVVNYKGTTPETSANAAYLVSINGEGGGDTPKPSGNHGTAEAPLTVAQAIALIDAETTVSEAFVKGKISQIDSYNDQYKSITYWISDDGTTTTQLQVYSGKGLNGADFTAQTDLKVGQTVTIKGSLKKYNTTYEFDKSSSIVSIDGEGGGDTPTPPTPTGNNLISNGDFETWTGDTPDNWNGAAGNATLEKSTNAHGGNTAVLIKTNSANKRLSYKAITLKKGTYNISFYAKAVTGTAKIAPGHVAIVNGAPDSQNYKYPETYPEVGTEWTAVNHSFTLDADTELCLVIMKHKSTGNDVIIDDYVLSTTDGGIVDGGGSGGDTPTPPSGNHGTAEAPLTVAQAIALIDAESTIDEAYVKGIISKIDSYNATYKSITYWISDDGGTTTQLQVYSGKGLNGADFASKEDLSVGKKVVIKGKLKKYNTTYEFDKTSSIISIE